MRGMLRVFFFLSCLTQAWETFQAKARKKNPLSPQTLIRNIPIRIGARPRNAPLTTKKDLVHGSFRYGHQLRRNTCTGRPTRTASAQFACVLRSGKTRNVRKPRPQRKSRQNPLKHKWGIYPKIECVFLFLVWLKRRCLLSGTLVSLHASSQESPTRVYRFDVLTTCI